MVNRDLLSAKLAELSHRIQRVKTHTPPTVEMLAADPDALDIVAFNMMLAVQVCADIASHLIADESWVVARTLAEAFGRLSENGVISAALAEQLKRAVGLRNVVAHGYSGIDVKLCHEAAVRGLSDLEQFAQQVTAWAQTAVSKPVS